MRINRLGKKHWEHKTEKLKLFVQILIAVTWLIGCSPADKSDEKEVRSAPASADEVGILVNGNLSKKSVQEKLSGHPDAKFRNLNENGLYEIFHVTKSELNEMFPDSIVENNRYLPNPTRRQAPYTSLKKYFKAHSIRGINILVSPQGNRSKKKKIDSSSCLLSPLAPQPVITGSHKDDNASRRVIRHIVKIPYGSKLILNASKSFSEDSQIQSAITVNWLVAQPQKSNQIKLLSSSARLNFKPRSPGHFKLGLLLQDEAGSCSFSYIDLLVSFNPPYQPNQKSTPVALDKFRHIPEIEVKKAWQKSKGENVVIALIGTGVNYNNPLLNRQILVDVSAKGAAGEAYRIEGYDYIDKDEFPYDENGRGTKLGGFLAASYFGVAKRAKLLVIKAMSSLGTDEGTLAAAIRFAVDKKAQIIYLPLGAFRRPGKTLKSAVDYSEANDVLIITSAGGRHPILKRPVDIDYIPYFPASLPNQNILVVAATTFEGNLAPYSNSGLETVDIGAPGGLPEAPLLTTGTGNSGTRNKHLASSWGDAPATALVAGVAALLLALDPALSVQDLKTIIVNSGSKNSSSNLRKGTPERSLNALNAINFWERNYKHRLQQ